MGWTSQRIAATLADEYARLPPGSQVATELEVARRFTVGRAAARAALHELERRLVVRRVQGRGTFTMARIDYLITPGQPASWSTTVREAGGDPRTTVLSCEPVPLPDEVAAHLGRRPGEPCHLLQRRSFIDGLSASWGREWVPISLVPSLRAALRVEPSLDAVLRATALVEPVRSTVRATVEPASAEVAEGLDCRTADNVWFIESVTVDGRDGAPLMFTQRWIRTDAVRVVLEVTRPTAA